MPLEALRIVEYVVTLMAFFHIALLRDTRKPKAHPTTACTFGLTGGLMCPFLIICGFAVNTILGAKKGIQLSNGSIVAIFQV
jgi:hypothetical protein